MKAEVLALIWVLIFNRPFVIASYFIKHPIILKWLHLDLGISLSYIVKIHYVHGENKLHCHILYVRLTWFTKFIEESDGQKNQNRKVIRRVLAQELTRGSPQSHYGSVSASDGHYRIVRPLGLIKVGNQWSGRHAGLGVGDWVSRTGQWWGGSDSMLLI